MSAINPNTASLLPFAVDRAEDTELSVQIERGLRAAIHNGVYAPDERLPGVRQIARALGTSNVAVTQAIDALVKDGLIATRPRSGTRVLARHEKAWKEHILWIGGSMQTYFFSARQETVSRALEKDNLRLTLINYNPEGTDSGNAMIGSCLQTMGISMVVNMVGVDNIREICQEHNALLIDCSENPDPAASGHLRKYDDSAMNELVAHIQILDVTSIGGFSPHPKQTGSLKKALTEIGVEMDILPVSWDGAGRNSSQEVNERSGYATVRNLVKNDSLPELLFIGDDYMARGAFTAILEAGIKIPDDLQLIMLSNKGNNIRASVDITRIENDPVAEGKVIHQLILDVLNANDTSQRHRISTLTFIPGTSTLPK